MGNKSSTFQYYTTHPMFGINISPEIQNTNPVKNLLNNYQHPLMKFSSKRKPFKGSIEDAQKLGYKHYIENGIIKEVPYPVEGSDTMSIQQRAKAQMEKYGITQEWAQDKSELSKYFYERSPISPYYDISQTAENVLFNKKIRKNGETLPRSLKNNPWRSTIAKKAFVGLSKLFGLDKSNNKLSKIIKMSEANLNEPDADTKLQAAAINLYSGYPVPKGIFTVSQIPIDSLPRSIEINEEFPYVFEVVDADKNIFSNNDYQMSEYEINDKRQASGHPVWGNYGRSVKDSGNLVMFDNWGIQPLTNFISQKNLQKWGINPDNIDAFGKTFKVYNVESDSSKVKRRAKLEEKKQAQTERLNYIKNLRNNSSLQNSFIKNIKPRVRVTNPFYNSPINIGKK